MAWTTRFTDRAKKELAKLDRPVGKRITTYLRRHIDEAADPRAVGEALQGSDLGSYWKYRIGNYRVIAEIQHRQVRVLVIRIGHRSKVYRP